MTRDDVLRQAVVGLRAMADELEAIAEGKVPDVDLVTRLRAQARVTLAHAGDFLIDENAKGKATGRT